jgi:hypothetical protein
MTFGEALEAYTNALVVAATKGGVTESAELADRRVQSAKKEILRLFKATQRAETTVVRELEKNQSRAHAQARPRAPGAPLKRGKGWGGARVPRAWWPTGRARVLFWNDHGRKCTCFACVTQRRVKR